MEVSSQHRTYVRGVETFKVGPFATDKCAVQHRVASMYDVRQEPHVSKLLQV
jgi:hypothetical protein